MSRERDFIARLAAFAHDPAARGLADDAAVLPLGDRDLVLTHDMLVEGVHYLADDPPGDVAWKLVAVNLSDLAAKGARPLGVLLGFPLGDRDWDGAFAAGLEAALGAFGVPLIGGDTVQGRGPRQLGLTAIGEVAPGGAPSRAGAQAGDALYVTGSIGAASLGLAILLDRHSREGGNPLIAALLRMDSRLRGNDGEGLVNAYRRPYPRLAEGRLLAPLVHAMTDISDGLLIDARRMAEASGLAIAIDLDAVPLPPGVEDDREARLAAATAGDDYELLFAVPPGLTLPQLDGVTITRVGRFHAGSGLTIADRDGAVPPPARLGYEHGAT